MFFIQFTLFAIGPSDSSMILESDSLFFIQFALFGPSNDSMILPSDSLFFIQVTLFGLSNDSCVVLQSDS